MQWRIALTIDLEIVAQTAMLAALLCAERCERERACDGKAFGRLLMRRAA